MNSTRKLKSLLSIPLVTIIPRSKNYIDKFKFELSYTSRFKDICISDFHLKICTIVIVKCI